MRFKNDNGITMVALVIIIVILAILAGVGVVQGNNVITSAKLQTLNTNMLLVQSKAKIIYEHNLFDSEEQQLLGQNVNDITDNEKINYLKEQNIIQANDDYEEGQKYVDYYIWDKSVLEDERVQLEGIELTDDFYVVNYLTEEVIYSDRI